MRHVSTMGTCRSTAQVLIYCMLYMRIVLHGREYDVTEFMSEHPGGSQVFKDGADLSQVFDDAHHSQQARERLKEFLVEPGDTPAAETQKEETEKREYANIGDIPLLTFLAAKLNASSLRKLFTKEDKGNIHKILGGFALLNYLYFFVDLWYSGCKGKMTLRPKGINLVLGIIPLICLSLSALAFHAPQQVNKVSGGMSETYQYQSVLFALRSFVLIIIISLFGKTRFTNIVIVCVLLLTMKGADEIERRFKWKEDKLVWKVTSVPFWSECPIYLRGIIKKTYVLAQLMFTAWAFNTDIETNMAATFIIQVTAFLATLQRKQFITYKGWHFLYLSEYLVIFLSWMRNPQTYVQVLIGIVCYVARVHIRVNKYALWSVYAVLHSFCTQSDRSLGSAFQHLTVLAVVLYTMSSREMLFDEKRVSDNNVVTKNHRCAGHHRISVKMGTKFKFQRGQHFNLYFNGVKRPYTPIGVTGENAEFLIKNYEDGDVSPRICKYYYENGDVNVLGPFGSNYYDAAKDSIILAGEEMKSSKILMFCCGTGITPFYSILTGLAESTHYRFHIHASFKSKADCFLIGDIPAGVCKKKCHYSDQGNRLTKQAVQKIVRKRTGWAVLICGTESYNAMVRESCLESGMHESQIVCW